MDRRSWQILRQASRLKPGRRDELLRCHGIAAPEIPRQRALIIEAARDRSRSDRLAAPQPLAGRVEPHLRQIGVRCEPDAALEQTDELERAEP